MKRNIMILFCYCSLKIVAFDFVVMGEVFKGSYSLNIFTFNSLINGLVMESNISNAVGWFNNSSEVVFQPDVITCVTRL